MLMKSQFYQNTKRSKIMTQTPRKKTYEQPQHSHDEWMETAKLNFSSYKHEKNRADAAVAREQRLTKTLERINQVTNYHSRENEHMDREWKYNSLKNTINSILKYSTLYPDIQAPTPCEKMEICAECSVKFDVRHSKNLNICDLCYDTCDHLTTKEGK
jgi:hypothetical protein